MGVYKGRRAWTDASTAREMRVQGIGATAIAEARSASAERTSTACWKPEPDVATQTRAIRSRQVRVAELWSSHKLGETLKS